MTSTKYPTDLTDAQWDKLLPYLLIVHRSSIPLEASFPPCVNPRVGWNNRMKTKAVRHPSKLNL